MGPPWLEEQAAIYRNENFMSPASSLRQQLADRSAPVVVIGMGYVGLPLAMAIARAGFPVTGLDIDKVKTVALNSGLSYISTTRNEELQKHLSAGAFKATTDSSILQSARVIIICVPTPLTKNRDPDLSFIRSTAEDIVKHLQPGTLVVLESTTYPGTTTEVMKPILERGGLKSGTDIFIGFSPEREDPGNQTFHTETIPKVVAGDGKIAGELVVAFYGAVVKLVVPVSSPSTAEAVKITENVFRAVNIALVNELKIIYDAMGIDVWEVIDAAKTKPFGFQAFYPGPGLGGHCIPIDPFYLTWKAREFEINTRFIELAGEINTAMPRHVVGKLEEALSNYGGKPLAGSRVLILGLAYKKNVSDMRESPTFKLMELLEKRGAIVDYHDPHIPMIPHTREHDIFTGRISVELNKTRLRAYDVVLLSTDHDGVDYDLVACEAKLIVDARNRFASVKGGTARVVKA
jgi:UDP-N-acetyl-D-glucosamine dehydrogenase